MRSIVERLSYNRRHPSQLNPLLFEDSVLLKSEVRERILEIVDEFLEYIQVDIKVLDIRLVGSNASYNYNEHSDLDIHITTNLSEISDPETIARLYFDSVKKNFKDSYDIKIKGIEVELYIEDVNATSISNGIYSVKNDEWIKEPIPVPSPSESTLSRAESLEDSILQSIEDADTVDELQEIIDNLYILRNNSLSKDGESGEGNIVFKSLRNKGILDKVKQVIRDATTKKLSLENKKIEEESSSISSWLGGEPWDDDLFHENARRLGLEVNQEYINVRGKELEFDYIILNSPVRFYHATTSSNIDSIRSKGLIPQSQAGGKYVSGVFLSGSKEGLSRWRSKDNLVIEVILPAGTKIYQDRQSNAVFVRENIPKSSIVIGRDPE